MSDLLRSSVFNNSISFIAFLFIYCILCFFMNDTNNFLLSGSPVSVALFRQERAAVRRDRSSELEPKRLIVSCSSELDICSNLSTESFPAAACRGQEDITFRTGLNWSKLSLSIFKVGFFFVCDDNCLLHCTQRISRIIKTYSTHRVQVDFHQDIKT